MQIMWALIPNVETFCVRAKAHKLWAALEATGFFGFGFVLFGSVWFWIAVFHEINCPAVQC